ncbi:hypothetical protein LJR225_004069 [Phenylobacterium sp. LjRoot225]|uniref:hypothetical protein n=1 Tax=Phenylobacterium sp. LjRoot225 TaxID=3342285 RepID=UPI003ED08DA7
MPASAAQSVLPPPPGPEVRAVVRDLLTSSRAFQALSPAKQQQVARDTALVASYLAAPEGIRAHKLAGGAPPARALDGDTWLAAPSSQNPPAQNADYQTARQAVTEIGTSDFKAGGAREGVSQMGAMVEQVNFTAFVGGLISGVFQAIVKSSIEQMEAYSSMIASVAKSLGQFMDDNVTDNQGRDHIVQQFPDTFEIGLDDFSGDPQPRLKLKEGVEEGDALKAVNNKLTFVDGSPTSLDLSDENAEQALVLAARVQLAKQRQQLLASMVMMGINRIVITDGKISAKVIYQFQAHDDRRLERSAQAFDFARKADGSLDYTQDGTKTWDNSSKRVGNYKGDYQGGGGSYSGNYTGDYSAESYAKGTHQYQQKPVMTAMSAAAEGSNSSLETRAQLAGNVEVNFKSDYLPLDKMATPGMIAAIQGNSTPVDPNVIPSARAAPAAVPGAAAPAAAPAPAA